MKNFVILAVVAVFFTAVGYFANQSNVSDHSSTSSYSGKQVERAISSVPADEMEVIRRIDKSILAVGTHKDDKGNLIPPKEQLKASLVELEAEANTHKDMPLVQIYWHALSPLKQMEGIMWRLRGVIETCSVCHLNALNFLRTFFYKDYLYGPHVDAILDYLVEPPTEKPLRKAYKSVTDAQWNYFRPLSKEDKARIARNPGLEKRESLMDAIEASIEGLETAVSKLPDNFRFQFDNRLLTGYDATKRKRFISQDKVSKTVVKGNFYYMIARRQRFLGFLYFFITYNFNDVPTLLNQVVLETGLNTVKARALGWVGAGDKPHVQTNTPMEFVAAIAKYPKLGANQGLSGDDCTEKTKRFLRRSHELYMNVQINRLKGLQESLRQSTSGKSEDYLIRPNVLRSNQEDFENALTERVAIWKKSYETGEDYQMTNLLAAGQIRVNPSAFFKCHKTLQAFLPYPKGQNGTSQVSRGSYTDRSKKIWRWNYDYGRPDRFKDPTFGGLIPDAEGLEGEEFYEVYRSFRTNPATRRMATVLPFL